MSELKAFTEDDGFDDDVDDIAGPLEKNFNRAAQYLATIVGKGDQGTLLEIYGLYKQNTVGDCNSPKPDLFSLHKKKPNGMLGTILKGFRRRNL